MITYRSVLEVLKWTEFTELCEQLNFVCKLWLKAADSEEVWNTVCEIHGINWSATALSSKTLFRTQNTQSTLFVVHTGLLFVYDVQNQAWKPTIHLEPPVSFDKLSSIVLYIQHIVVTGSSDPITARSALIHTETGQITPLPHMISARYRHGSLLYRSSVYVFAGSVQMERCSNKAEKLNLQSRSQWTALPNLLCDFSFSSPCRKDTFAYIFGGWGTNLCQSFDLTTETFALLPFTTPAHGFLTTAVLYQGDIIFCQSNYMVKWSGRLEVPIQVERFTRGISANW